MIQIRGLKKSFDQHVVLDGIDLDVEKGETRVIIGGSGEGKSVLLKMIIGLLEPDEGTIIVRGIRVDCRDRHSLEDVRKSVGMLFQSSALFDSMSVRGNVGFALDENPTIDSSQITGIVREKLALVNLEGVEDLTPAELSGGMKKRVSLARALAANPEIMLYDEPTTGLDPINADAINNLIVDLQRKLSVTSLVVTHDIQSAYKVADRISMLHQGKIIATGTPQEIKRSSDSYVQQFIAGHAQPIAQERWV
jgi:phospholipid/cholesterol/gamma-HCH transport system ATP-binding protein